MKIAVNTADRYLFQKIRLILLDTDDIEIYDEGKKYDLILTDTEIGDTGVRKILMGYEKDAELPLPFSEEELVSSIRTEPKKGLLSLEKKCAVLKGKRIALTELEYSLLDLLYSGKGGFISREEIIGRVFEPGVSDSLLNVYIHYLREKLEKDDEKIIISSRKFGYKINERYL